MPNLIRMHTVGRNKNIRLVDVKDILYFECVLHQIRVVCVNGDFFIRYTMRQLEADFSKFGFIRVMSGYVVNMGHAVSIKYGKIMMDNGEEIPISRKRRSWVVHEFHLFNPDKFYETKTKKSVTNTYDNKKSVEE